MIHKGSTLVKINVYLSIENVSYMVIVGPNIKIQMLAVLVMILVCNNCIVLNTYL